jgi:NAD-dependent SIR2 family protein deacetylase
MAKEVKAQFYFRCRECQAKVYRLPDSEFWMTFPTDCPDCKTPGSMVPEVSFHPDNDSDNVVDRIGRTHREKDRLIDSIGE